VPDRGRAQLIGVTRVALFSYGGVIEPLRSFFADARAELAAVVLPSNRSAPALAAARAGAAGLDVLTQPPQAEAGSFAADLHAIRPDLFVVWHYSMVLPPVVLQIPPLGAVNVHGGLLPDYRGAHVLQWAIVNGERETGVTLHYVDEGIDTGPIIAEVRVSIGERDDAASLSASLQAEGLRLLGEHWAAITSGTAAATPQSGGGRYWPLRTPADGVIDWNQPAVGIRNLVRALVPPWPGATTLLGGTEIVVDRAEVVDASGAPGTVIAVDRDRIVVAAGEGAIAIVAARRGEQLIESATLGLRPGDKAG
jgi:methionyl-tRNA formyltransferase